MNKVLIILLAACAMCLPIKAKSYMPISLIEMDSDFFAIGHVKEVYEKTAILSCSHLMRNLSRQPEKRKDKEFRIILSGDEIKEGSHGIWILYRQSKANSVFLAKKLPEDYPNYQKIAGLIRSKDYLFQDSPWVGIWKSKDESLEVYLGESRFGYIKENEQVSHCMWNAETDGDILSVYVMTEEGSYKEGDYFEMLDSVTIFCRPKGIRLRKLSGNQTKQATP